MAKATRNKLIIPYFISIIFVAISINSIAQGIENHETWRIIIAAIGGSFFLGVALWMIVRLLKDIRKSTARRKLARERVYGRTHGNQNKE